MLDINECRREALRLAGAGSAYSDGGRKPPEAVIARATAYLAFLEGATTDPGAEVQPEALSTVSGTSAPVPYGDPLDQHPGVINDAHVIVHLYGIRRSEWASIVSAVADVAHGSADSAGFDVSCSGMFGNSGDHLVAEGLVGPGRTS